MKIAKGIMCILLCFAMLLPVQSKAYATDTDTTDTEEVIYKDYDNGGTTVTDIFTAGISGDLTSYSYLPGLYKIKGENAQAGEEETINLYSLPQDGSEVCATISKNTYHNITKLENFYGYVEHKDKKGWIKLKETQKICPEVDESLVTLMNTSVTLITALDEDDTAYTQASQALSDIEAHLARGESEELAYTALHTELSLITDIDKAITAEKENKSYVYRLYGDVNSDNLLNMADVVIIQRFIVNLLRLSAVEEIAADVDVNSIVNMKDIVSVQYILCKLIARFSSGRLFLMFT